MPLFLNQDVQGLCSRIHYGNAGDEVTVLSDQDNVMIVEAHGQWFPVHKSKLTDTWSPAEAAPAQQAAIEEIKHPPKRKPKATAKQVSITQTLF